MVSGGGLNSKASPNCFTADHRAGSNVHVHDFISSETLLSRLYCTAANPIDREDIAPKKQTIRNALKRPQGIVSLGQSCDDTQMPSKSYAPE